MELVRVLRTWWRPFWLSTLLLLAGQAFLIVIAPLTRAAGEFTELAGIGILSPDSRGYLGTATSLEAVQSWPWMRRGYPFVLFVLGQIGDPVALAVVVHVIALLTASMLLYREVEQHSSAVPAVLATAVLVANPMTAQWVRLILTESLFFAGIVTLLIFGHRALHRRLSPSEVIAASFVAGLLPLLRPNGVFVLVSLVSTIFLARLRGPVRALAIGGTWLALLSILPAANAAVGPPPEGSLTSQLYAGVVVEGTEHVRYTIDMPAAADDSDVSLSAAAQYALKHPGAIARVAAARVGAEVLQVRPHYPRIVNLALGTAMLLYIAASAIGLRDVRSRAWTLLAVNFSLPLVILTAGTFASPEGRYGWAFLLPLAPLAGLGSRIVIQSIVTRPGRRKGRAGPGIPN